MTPVSMVLVGIFVCAAFAGSAVLTQNANTLPLGDPALVEDANSDEYDAEGPEAEAPGASDVDLGADDQTEGLIEDSFKEFLHAFKGKTSAEIIERAQKSLGKAIDAAKNTPGSVTVEQLASINAKAEGTKVDLENLDSLPDPDWLAQASSSRRRLLGNDAEKVGMEVADSLKMSVNDMEDSFDTIAKGLPKILAKLENTGDDATVQTHLVDACLNLAAVAARAAPEPFGKNVPNVYENAYGAVHDILPLVDIEAFTALVEAAVGRPRRPRGGRKLAALGRPRRKKKNAEAAVGRPRRPRGGRKLE